MRTVIAFAILMVLVLAGIVMLINHNEKQWDAAIEQAAEASMQQTQLKKGQPENRTFNARYYAPGEVIPMRAIFTDIFNQLDSLRARVDSERPRV